MFLVKALKLYPPCKHSAALYIPLQNERVLFHYNGHGVPRPTANGEIWVFNKSYTQYIPMSIYDLQAWVGSPAIYVFDCSAAGLIINSFRAFAEQRTQVPPSCRCALFLAAGAASLIIKSVCTFAEQRTPILPPRADVPQGQHLYKAWLDRCMPALVSERHHWDISYQAVACPPFTGALRLLRRQWDAHKY